MLIFLSPCACCGALTRQVLQQVQATFGADSKNAVIYNSSPKTR